MPVLKAVQLAVESELPEDLRKYDRPYNAKALDAMLVDLYAKHPDKFATVQHRIATIGRNTTWKRGDTVRLSDLAPVIDRDALYAQMDKEVDAVNKEYAKNPEMRDKLRNEIFVRYSTMAEKATMNSFGSKDNNVVTAVAIGSRGKPAQVKAMLSTPGVYTDSKGQLIPVFIRRSYSDGLRPGEFLAGTFGARSSVVDTKKSTARGGEMLKLAISAAVNEVVTEKDCGADTGIAFGMDESKDLLYRVLAKPTAGFPAGTFIDKRVLSALKVANPKSVIARSAITCQASKGLCSKCAGGFMTEGKLPKIGTHIGVTAGESIFEPVVQSALSSKHTAGITGTKKTFAGLDVLSQFLQSPENMEFRAAVADNEGVVTKIEPAPQGGNYVFVGGTRHYVKPGYEVLVKQGDRVEPGDQLGDGIVDARDIVRTRGLGEGRKHYATRLAQILADSGASANRQQTEVLARGALNHIEIDDIDGFAGNLPDDIVPYQTVRGAFNPDDAEDVDPGKADGKYLVSDVLHFTTGTKLTPRMLKQIKDNGVDSIRVSSKTPGFTPIMPRLRTAAHAQDDWLAVLGTNYLSKNLNEAVTRAADTNVESNVNFIPRLAIGENFGKNIETTGTF